MSTRQMAEDRNVVNGRDGQQLLVLLSYEDLSTGLRARQAFEQTVRQLELEADFEFKLWRFALMGEAALLERAVAEAAEADIVFLSVHGQTELPAAIQLWLERWLARRSSEPCALAVSLDPGARNSAAAAQMLEFVQGLAQPAGVEVFLHAGEPPAAELEKTIDGLPRRAEAGTAGREEFRHRFGDQSYREWGNND